jgi:hypothetical protein
MSSYLLTVPCVSQTPKAYSFSKWHHHLSSCHPVFNSWLLDSLYPTLILSIPMQFHLLCFSSTLLSLALLKLTLFGFLYQPANTFCLIFSPLELSLYFSHIDLPLIPHSSCSSHHMPVLQASCFSRNCFPVLLCG